MSSNADILSFIQARASVPKVQPDRPPRDQIEQVLAAGVAAPNHYRTQPWRFAVLAGEARERLGDVLAESAARRETEDTPEAQARAEREQRKPLRAPVIVAVAAEPSDLPKAREEEELAAVAAAVENMLLAAQALGLGAMWRTGEPARDPAVREFLGFSPRARIVAFLYIGYPAEAPGERRAVDVDEFTRWLGWPDE